MTAETKIPRPPASRRAVLKGAAFYHCRSPRSQAPVEIDRQRSLLGLDAKPAFRNDLKKAVESRHRQTSLGAYSIGLVITSLRPTVIELGATDP